MQKQNQTFLFQEISTDPAIRQQILERLQPQKGQSVQVTAATKLRSLNAAVVKYGNENGIDVTTKQGCQQALDAIAKSGEAKDEKFDRVATRYASHLEHGFEIGQVPAWINDQKAIRNDLMQAARATNVALN